MGLPLRELFLGALLPTQQTSALPRTDHSGRRHVGTEGVASVSEPLESYSNYTPEDPWSLGVYTKAWV